MSRTFSAVEKAGINITNQEPQFEAYYDQGRKEYLARDSREGWVNIGESSLRRMLRMAGYDDRARRGEAMSPLDVKIIETQTAGNVHFAGPVAGYNVGVYENGGIQFLVTQSPKIIEPDPARDWPTLRALVEGMFDLAQRIYLYGWLKCSYSRPLKVWETNTRTSLLHSWSRRLR